MTENLWGSLRSSPTLEDRQSLAVKEIGNQLAVSPLIRRIEAPISEVVVLQRL